MVALRPVVGGPRYATALGIGIAVAIAVGALDRLSIGGPAPVFDVEDLVAQSPAAIDHDVIVTGTWTATAPTVDGHFRVIVCGQKGSRAVCHFENVAPADRSRLERRLIASSEVAIRGRCEQVSDGVAVLGDCRLIDGLSTTE